MMMVRVRDKAPIWTANAIMPSTKEKKLLSLSQYNGRYVVLIFISTSFKSLSLSEIISYSKRQIEFDAINCQLIIVCNDSYYTILSCINNFEEEGLKDLKIPIVSDFNMRVVKQYGMLHDDAIMEGIVLISDNGIIRHISINHNTGDNIDEVVRLVKAFQFTDKNGEVCPVNWNPGDATIRATPTDSRDFFSQSLKESTSDNSDRTSVRLRTTREYTPLEEAQMQSTLLRLQRIIGSSSDYILTRIKNLIETYNRNLRERPLITKAITSGVIAVISEGLRIYITKRKLAYNLTTSTQKNHQIMNPQDILSLSRASTFSWQKLVTMGSFGCLVSGPLHHYWYKFLDHIVANKLSVPMRIKLLVKVAIHQLALTPSFLYFTLGFMKFLACHSTTSTYNTIQALYIRTLFTNWKIITLFQAINLGNIIPQSHKVLVNDLINMWWYSYLNHLILV